ncbi:MAG TPA: beta-galactosidase [Armatimonadota bacterium]|nr:beta-galactosidase [Armatimonadota bacterium]
MEIVVCGIPFGKEGENDALHLVKDLGFTSVQIYTFWKEFEVADGVFDWSHYDRQVSLIQQAGLKYVPFILMGPKYAAPSWWLNHPDHVGLRCLEHGKLSPIESIWNPHFRTRVSRALDAFAEHYLPWNVLESVQPGICGDYGEAIFPVHGNWPGDYHTHRGYWCGGDDAIASLRAYVQGKYPSIAALNDAWHSHYDDFAHVTPFRKHQAPSRTAYLELIEWYRHSMTEYAEFWVRECRRCFPETSIYLCTGGEEEPEHGSSFAAQAKICGKYDAGLRLTNEANKFYDNFQITAHTWAACQFYGAYLGLEPVGPITEKGLRSRAFSSIAFGDRQIFHYYGNFAGADNTPLPAAGALADYRRFAKERQTPKGIAVFWPEDRQVLEGQMPPAVTEAMNFVRRHYPVSPLSEQMILDGALRDFSCLVMLNVESTRRSVLEIIADWVNQQAGTVLTNGRVMDIELTPCAEFDALFGILPTSEETHGWAHLAVRASADFPCVAELPPFGATTQWMDLADDTEFLAGTTSVEGYSGTKVAQVAAMFRRKSPSGGQAICYTGATNFTPDPEALMKDPGVFPALLADVCAMSGVRYYDLREGEIARTDYKGNDLVLREDSIVLEKVAVTEN